MQPLAAWQLKLAELEAACRDAEQLMLQAPTRAERSAALDLAGELKIVQLELLAIPEHGNNKQRQPGAAAQVICSLHSGCRATCGCSGSPRRWAAQNRVTANHWMAQITQCMTYCQTETSLIGVETHLNLLFFTQHTLKGCDCA
jgi:hypothetical protein